MLASAMQYTVEVALDKSLPSLPSLQTGIEFNNNFFL